MIMTVRNLANFLSWFRSPTFFANCGAEPFFHFHNSVDDCIYIYIYIFFIFFCLPVLSRSSKYYHKHMGFPRDFIAGQSPVRCRQDCITSCWSSGTPGPDPFCIRLRFAEGSKLMKTKKKDMKSHNFMENHHF